MRVNNPAVSAGKSRSYNGDYMERGKATEKIVMGWLASNPGVLGIDDLTSLRPLMEADVDCSIKLMDGRITFAEIKSDKWISKHGNVLFEILRINHTAPADKAITLGWTGRSPAKWLVYYSPKSNTIFKCQFDDLRRVFQKHTKANRAETKIIYVPTDNIKSTLNVLIPFSECEKIFGVYDL